MAKGKKKAATDSQRQTKRRDSLREEFGPSVDIHLSEINKKRLDRIVSHMVNMTNAELSTRTRSIAIGELINAYCIENLLKIKNESAKKIHDIHNKLWEFDEYKEDPSYIAEKLTKESLPLPIKKGDVVLFKNKSWTEDDVIYFSKSENLVNYILLSNKK